MSPTDRAHASPSSPPEMRAAEWVAGFANGWRAPAGPESFVAHFRALLAPEGRMIQTQLKTTVGHRRFADGFVRPLCALMPDLHGEVDRWGAREDSLYIVLPL